MKQTTIDMLDSAMALNVEIQEDNLNLQEMKQHLLQMNQELNNTDIRKSFENIDINTTAIQNQISLELLSMIDGSVADLNKQYRYAHFAEIPDKSAIMYNAGTIWNMCTCFRSMLSSLGKIGNEDLSYKEMRQKFINENEIDIMITNTNISDEDYVEVNLAQPKYQSLYDADMSKDNLNAASKALNNVVTHDIIANLTNTKYRVSSKLSEDKVDAIKTAHFIAQVTMAIKNALLLMKNYHNATLNELA